MEFVANELFVWFEIVKMWAGCIAIGAKSAFSAIVNDY
jgi:hypothetical protein